MKLSEILEKFPDHVNYGERADIIYEEWYVGQVHQDNVECIFETTTLSVKRVREFLSKFKYRKLLSPNMGGYKLDLYLLQEMLDE